jgi:glycosyltransferase involved in cell wall biosynthesis
MRILSINHTADLYGASRCLERVASRFTADGHDLIVVIPTAGTLQKVLERDRVCVLLHPWLPALDRGALKTIGGKLRMGVAFPISVLWLAWTILRFRVDVVHTNSAMVFSPAFAAKLTGRPHIWHIREFFHEFPSLWRRYERAIHSFSKVVVAISEAVKEQFSPDCRSKIEIVYDGLPRAEFYRPALDAAAEAFKQRFGLTGIPLVGVIGRLKWVRKGQEVLIRAAALLRGKYPTAKYLIVGTPALGNEDHLVRFHELVDTLNLRDHVIFTGDVDDVRPVYAALNVSVAPAIDPEPFGCIVIESLALGTPVVGSNAAGIAEQIVDGENGLLFPPGDEGALAQSLDRILGDPALRATMSANGIEKFLSEFEMDRCYEEYLRIFERATKPPLRLGQPIKGRHVEPALESRDAASEPRP